MITCVRAERTGHRPSLFPRQCGAASRPGVASGQILSAACGVSCDDINSQATSIVILRSPRGTEIVVAADSQLSLDSAGPVMTCRILQIQRNYWTTIAGLTLQSASHFNSYEIALEASSLPWAKARAKRSDGLGRSSLDPRAIFKERRDCYATVTVWLKSSNNVVNCYAGWLVFRYSW